MGSKSHLQPSAVTKALLMLPLDEMRGERKAHAPRAASSGSVHDRRGSMSADNTPILRSKSRGCTSSVSFGGPPYYGADGAPERDTCASRALHGSRRPPPMRSPTPGERPSWGEASVKRVHSMPTRDRDRDSGGFCSLPDAQPAKRNSIDLSGVHAVVHRPGEMSPKVSPKVSPKAQQQTPLRPHHHHQHHSSQRNFSAPHASSPALQRRRCEAISVAAAAVPAVRDPVAAVPEDEPGSPDSSRMEERRSKNSWELRRKNSRLKPAKRSGWCEESQGPTPQASSRALSVVSTAASSQDEVTSPSSPLHAAVPALGRSTRSWLSDFGDALGTDRESTRASPPAVYSPNHSSRYLAQQAEEEWLQEVAHARSEPMRRAASHKPSASAWVTPMVPALRSPAAAASKAEKGSPFATGGARSPEKQRPLSAARQLARRLEVAPADPPPKRKEVRRLEEGDKIYDLYSWDKVLQEEGNGGKVVICRSKAAGEDKGKEYVMKMRSRAELRKLGLEDQFGRVSERLLNLPHHPGVARVFEVLEDDTFFYVVMEKANAGPLFGCLISEFRDGCMPAAAVRQVMRDILEALGHVHKQGLLHRDIKPDNLVMHRHNDGPCGSSSRKRVMLIDFDHADPNWSPRSTPEETDEVFGTLLFNAPEALLGKFLPQGDLYSVGVILYLMMTGRFPFPDEVFEELQDAEQPWSRGRREGVCCHMQEASIDFDGTPWAEQPACRDLCRKLLAFEASERPASAGEALRHPWFRQEELDSPGRPLQ